MKFNKLSKKIGTLWTTVYELTCVMDGVKPAVELRWIRLYLGGSTELDANTTITPVVLPANTSEQPLIRSGFKSRISVGPIFWSTCWPQIIRQTELAFVLTVSLIEPGLMLWCSFRISWLILLPSNVPSPTFQVCLWRTTLSQHGHQFK